MRSSKPVIVQDIWYLQLLLFRPTSTYELSSLVKGILLGQICTNLHIF